MKTVEDAMEENVIILNKSDKISDANKILAKFGISGVPIVDDDNNLVGILSEGDIMSLIEVPELDINPILPSPLDVFELPIRMKHEFDLIEAAIKKASSLIVEEIMTTNVITISGKNSLSDAAEIMDKKSVNRLPVLNENNELVGIITRGDIIAALVE